MSHQSVKLGNDVTGKTGKLGRDGLRNYFEVAWIQYVTGKTGKLTLIHEYQMQL